MWSPDTPSQNPSWAFTQLILAFTAIGGFGYMMYLTKMERPVSKRSYPFDGLREELGGGEMGVKVSTGGICVERLEGDRIVTCIFM